MPARKWLRRGALLALVALSAFALRASADTPASRAPSGGWQEVPAFVRLFTPRSVPAGTYHAYVTNRGLDAVLQSLEGDPGLSIQPGAWQVQALIPFDAFGQSGAYDRWKVARLYGGSRAQVARGPRVDRDGVVEAWTLISPFPDEQLQRLNSGTLLIVLRLRPQL